MPGKQKAKESQGSGPTQRTSAPEGTKRGWGKSRGQSGSTAIVSSTSGTSGGSPSTAAPAEGMGCWPDQGQDEFWNLESGKLHPGKEESPMTDSSMKNYVKFLNSTWAEPSSAAGGSEKLPPMLPFDHVAITEEQRNIGWLFEERKDHHAQTAACLLARRAVAGATGDRRSMTFDDASKRQDAVDAIHYIEHICPRPGYEGKLSEKDNVGNLVRPVQAFRRNVYKAEVSGQIEYYMTPNGRWVDHQKGTRELIFGACHPTRDPERAALSAAAWQPTIPQATFGASATAAAVSFRKPSVAGTVLNIDAKGRELVDNNVDPSVVSRLHCLIKDTCAKPTLSSAASRVVARRGDDEDTIREYGFPKAPATMPQEQVARAWQYNTVQTVITEAMADVELFTVFGQLSPVGPVPCAFDLWEKALDYLWVANGHEKYHQGLCPQQRRTLNQSGWTDAARGNKFKSLLRNQAYPSLPLTGGSPSGGNGVVYTVPYQMASHVPGEGTTERKVVYANGLWEDLPRFLPCDTPGVEALSMTVIGDSSCQIVKYPGIVTPEGHNPTKVTKRDIGVECTEVVHNSKVMCISGGKICDILEKVQEYVNDYGIGQDIPNANTMGEAKPRVSIAPREQILVIKIHGNDAITEDGIFKQPTMETYRSADLLA